MSRDAGAGRAAVTLWNAVLVASIICVALKTLGYLIPTRPTRSAAPARIADLLTVALLAALVAVQTLGVGQADRGRRSCARRDLAQRAAPAAGTLPGRVVAVASRRRESVGRAAPATAGLGGLGGNVGLGGPPSERSGPGPASAPTWPPDHRRAVRGAGLRHRRNHRARLHALGWFPLGVLLALIGSGASLRACRAPPHRGQLGGPRQSGIAARCSTAGPLRSGQARRPLRRVVVAGTPRSSTMLGAARSEPWAPPLTAGVGFPPLLGFFRAPPRGRSSSPAVAGEQRHVPAARTEVIGPPT